MGKKACMYVRVSTEDKQDTSRQISELREQAQSQGFEIDDSAVFSENISGFKKGKERPVFSKLMNQIRENPKRYSKVYIHEISRLARDPNEARRILDELTDLNVSVYVKSLNMESLDKDGKTSFVFTIIFTILSEFARSEAEYLKMRSKSGMTDKMKKGHAGAGIMFPYGYAKDENKQLMIDQEESKIIREIFNHTLQGLGSKQIAFLLNKKGVKTRLQKASTKGTLKMRKYKIEKTMDEIKWVDGTIYAILKNPVYKGERLYKGETIKAPAIIDAMTWDKVQKVMADRYNVSSGNTRYLYLLKDICTCAKCGRNYIAHYRVGGKDAFYHCSSKREGKGCGNTGVSIEALETVIYDLLQDSPKVWEHIKTSKTETNKIDNELNYSKTQLQILKGELMNKENELDRVMQLFIKGLMDNKRMDSETKRVNRNIDSTKREIETLQSKIKSLSKQQLRLNNIQTYSDALFNLKNDRFQLQQIFQSLIERVSVRSVNEYNNNTQWIVSLWLKGISEPQTVLLQTSRFRKPNSRFIDPGVAKHLGQNWIKYFGSVADDGEIKYDKNWILKTPVETTLKVMFELDEEKAKDWSLNEWHPVFLPFQEINTFKDKKKKLKAA